MVGYLFSLVVGMSVSPARTSEIRVYSGGAPHRVLTALAPAFESATGHQLAMTFEIVSRIQERLAAGDRPDVIMLPEELIVETAKIVPLLPQGRTVLARVGIGVIVAEGADHPDLSDEDSVRSALRGAKAIALADPRTPSGRYLDGMLQRLGLLEELQGRLIHKGGDPRRRRAGRVRRGGHRPLSGQRGRAHRRCERCRTAAACVAELRGLWRGHSGLQSIARCGACHSFPS